ncbi:Diacylglycerol kinase OS=Streptomyces tendae OX=1932 GN=GUR47_19800 PE=4 SV=1 [Streptomyces tendae]
MRLSVVPVAVGARPRAGPWGCRRGRWRRRAARGVERACLLVDDSDGVVLGAVGIPPAPVPVPVREDTGTEGGAGPEPAPGGPGPVRPWLRTCQSLVRTLATSRPARTALAPGAAGPARLRLEVDGVTLVDLDQPVEAVTVMPGAGGVALVEVRPLSVGAQAAPLTASGRTVTVSGAHFRYRADAVVCGPVGTRTWVAREGAWGLTLPAG